MNRPSAASVAAAELTSTYVFFSGPQSDGLTVIRDGELLLPGTVDSVSIQVDVSDDANPVLTGVISLVAGSGAASRFGNSIPLFPGFVEVMVAGKRLQLVCPNTGDLSTLWFGVGMRTSGEATPVQGVTSLQVLLAAGLGATAELLWADNGLQESLLD
jgi:hypothetical protein